MTMAVFTLSYDRQKMLSVVFQRNCMNLVRMGLFILPKLMYPLTRYFNHPLSSIKPNLPLKGCSLQKAEKPEARFEPRSFFLQIASANLLTWHKEYINEQNKIC